MFRVARKIRVGRETGNTHIFFFWPEKKKLTKILINILKKKCILNIRNN